MPDHWLSCDVFATKWHSVSTASDIRGEHYEVVTDWMATISLPSAMDIRQGQYPRNSPQGHHLNTCHITISNIHIIKKTTAALKKPKINCSSHPDTTRVHTQSKSKGTHPTIIHEQRASRFQGQSIFHLKACCLLPKLTELLIAAKKNKLDMITVIETLLSSGMWNEAINLSDYVKASRTDR